MAVNYLFNIKNENTDKLVTFIITLPKKVPLLEVVRSETFIDLLYSNDFLFEDDECFDLLLGAGDWSCFIQVDGEKGFQKEKSWDIEYQAEKVWHLVEK